MTFSKQTKQPNRPDLGASSGGDSAPRRLQRFSFTVGGFALLTAGFYLYLFNQFGVRSALLTPVLILVMFALLPLALFLMRRGRETPAALLALISSGLAYAANEVAWQGLTPYHLLGGLLLLYFSAQMLLPRRYSLWALLAVGYLVLILGINFFSASLSLLGLRVAYDTMLLLLPFAIISNGLLLMVILGQRLLLFQLQSLRSRLLLLLILSALLPAAVIGVSASLLGANDAQVRLLSQLESVVTLKQAELNAWQESLSYNLLSLLPEEDELWLFESLFRGEEDLLHGTAIERLTAGYNQNIARTGLFEEIFVLDAQGQVVLSTNPGQVGRRYASQSFFQNGQRSLSLSPVVVAPDLGKETLVAAAPVLGSDGNLIAVVAGRADLTRLDSIMTQRAGLGETGETFLLLPANRLLTPSRFSGYSRDESYVVSTLNAGMIRGLNEPGAEINGSGLYLNYRNTPAIGYYRWLPDMELLVVAEQEQSEALASINRVLLLTALLSLASLAIAFVVAAFASQRITAPLAKLAALTLRISAGELDVDIAAETGISPAASDLENALPDEISGAQLNEISALAGSFAAMTAQLRILIAGLEQRVAERTGDLERRSRHLQIAAEVAREASAIRDLDELLQRGVQLVRERFGYDHAGLFLTDERAEYAVLVAATGEAGRKMLERSHKLKIGETGMVGFVARTGQVRVANDVRADLTFAVNPLLPDTRAEADLPLRVGARIIGVLDVQSHQPGIFTPEILDVMQILADQLAVAIESARTFRQMRETVRELEVVYGSYTRDSWRAARQRLYGVSGYRYRGLNVEPVGADAAPLQLENQASSVTLPLLLRDQEIGELKLHFRQHPDEVTLDTFRQLGSRLTLLLENARLLQDAQSLAVREQQINQIANQVRSSMNLDAILRSTVRELGSAFGSSRAFVQLVNEETLLASEQNSGASLSGVEQDHGRAGSVSPEGDPFVGGDQ